MTNENKDTGGRGRTTSHEGQLEECRVWNLKMQDLKEFPVVMYGCESWTIKKAERWRIDAFELWCWRRLLRVPWTSRRSNQSILKEISSEYSLEGLMLKLNLQYFGHLMRRTDSLEKTLMLRKTEGRRRRGRQRMRWLDHRLDGHEFEQFLGAGDRQGILVCSIPWGRQESDTTEQLNWSVPQLLYFHYARTHEAPFFC